MKLLFIYAIYAHLFGLLLLALFSPKSVFLEAAVNHLVLFVLLLRWSETVSGPCMLSSHSQAKEPG